MGTPGERIGAKVGPVGFVVDGERSVAFAEAIGDHHPAHLDGRQAPPLFIVVPTFDLVVRTLAEAVGDVPLSGGVHGEEDIRVHQPLGAGMRLDAVGAVHSVRVRPSGTRIAIRVEVVDGDGRPVVEHLWTTFLRGAELGESAGPAPPDHELTDGHRLVAARHVAVPVPDDVTWRYAEASGDLSPFHTDPAAAQAAGFPTIILHGMCTLGLAVAALDPVANRVAVRFARAAHPGHPLELSVHDLGDGVQVFEATSQGVPVLTNGRLEP
jgi:acyl dehydratase